MARPTKLELKIIADALNEAERHRHSSPETRTCPHTADRPWYLQQTYGDCIGKAYPQSKKTGLDENGNPLTRPERPLCGAMTRRLLVCSNRVVPGKIRCRFHGGLSTGPKTANGKARIAAAQNLRWVKWRAAQKVS